jgi:hypothetical protein
MPRQSKLPSAKTPDARDDESLLLRSAESLGRVIGALQRQLDGATRRLADTADMFDQERTTPARSPGSRKRRSGTSKSKGVSSQPVRAQAGNGAAKRKAAGSSKRAASKKTAGSQKRASSATRRR